MNLSDFPATFAIYYDDAYQTTFKAKILSIKEEKDRLFDIILDQTAFFPEGGGQSCDRGVLAGGMVLDVQIFDGVIYHRVSFPEPDVSLPAKGDIVSGEVNWEYRFSNMQQHTGEHIFSGLVNKYFGYENVGFHLSDNTITMDYNGPLTPEDIARLEISANEAIQKNLPVIARFPGEYELEHLEYRAKLNTEAMGRVRIVTIGGGDDKVDSCACCAPHVLHTAEVGLLKVIDRINYKGGTRVSILCGMRALNDYNEKHESLSTLSHKLSVPIEDVIDGVEKLYRDIKDHKERIYELEEQLLWHALSRAHKHNHPVIFTNISDNNLLKNTANDLLASGNSPIFILNGTDIKGYNFIIASDLPEDTKIDAVNILHLLSEHLDILGGGKNPMVSGRINATAEEIEKVVDELIQSFANLS